MSRLLWDYHHALWKLLSHDLELKTMVKGVFLHVPPKTVFPYIVIPHLHYVHYSTSGVVGKKIHYPIECYSATKGVKELMYIMEIVEDCLQKSKILPKVAYSTCNSSHIASLQEGTIWQGIMDYYAIIENIEENVL